MSAQRLRIVFFGTGGLLSAACLRAVAARHEVLAVVRALTGGRARFLAGRFARTLHLRQPDPLADAARTAGLRQWPITSVREAHFAQRMTRLCPDLLCVAHFPWRLPEGILGTAALGGVNLHTSLLPRHRGPLPLFWVYHADDRETGVTVHQMTNRFDDGDIIAQESFPLTRGYPADALNADNARVGAELLAVSVSALARGQANARPQDDNLATRAPLVPPGTAMVDFDAWDVERVWHFLAGVSPRFIEPITDVEGRSITYTGVLGYECGAAGGPLGLARRLDGRVVLQCRDGIVILRAP